MIAKYNLRAERSVTRESEINGILCVLGGAAELAFAPGASKIAGAVLVLAGGVCAGVAEAHHGNGLRVHNIELNYGEAIRLLAGEKFLSELDAVETNQEFGDLFARHQINCKPGLFIRLEEGRLRQDARVIVGSRVVPIPGAERLARGREGDEQGNDDGGACVIS